MGCAWIFFIKEWSSDEMSKFKEEFEKCVMCHYLKDNLVRNKHKWDELFCLSDDPVSKNDKRNEEDESDYSKQLSSLQ